MWHSAQTISVHSREHGSHTVQVVKPFWKGQFKARCSCGFEGPYTADYFKADRDRLHHWQHMGGTYD